MASDAKCLISSKETSSFNDYLNSCRKPDDTSRANNFFSESIVNFKGVFQGLRAQYTDLITAADSQNSILSLSGNTTQGVDTQIEGLEKKKEKLIQEIEYYQGTSEALNRVFLEDIMHGTPKPEMFPSLQDISIGLFLFGWVTICIILVLVRWGSPGGTWRAGVFTLILLILVSLCVYALLMNVV
jgi:hypothetical protein